MTNPASPSEDDRDGETETFGPRTCHVSRDAADDPLGVAVFIGADELAALGVDPETTDAVEFAVEDGEVRLDATDDAADDHAADDHAAEESA